MRKVLILTVFVNSLSAYATTFVVPTDREMVRRADAIVIGSALDSYTQWRSDGDRSRQAHNEVVIDMAELRRMSQAERQELARLLAELGVPVPLAGSAAPQKPATPRQDIDTGQHAH